VTKRWLLPAIAATLIIAGGAVLGILALSGQGGGGDPIANAALTNARTTMAWQSGPDVQSVHVVQLSHLSQALKLYADPAVASHVNVSDLIRRFGRNQSVGLVILAGTFNSLAPDEGVILHQAAAVVDATTYKVILLSE
jgi:hypothetical protein